MYRIIHTFILFTVVALSVHLATAQDASTDKGVRFEHELSWTQAKAKATSEQKYLFVDCFTTWCGPCRFMRNTIFPQAEMGSFFNDKFVSIEVQLDSTAKDDDRVKSWYADAHYLMTQYSIQAFPTYLVFSPDGRLVHRIVGGRETAGEFIGVVRECFDSTKQYYTQLRQFEAGRRDTTFLRRLAEQSLDVYDMPDGAKVFTAWLATQPSPYTSTGIHLMQEFTHHTTDAGFDIFLHHAREANKVLGVNEAERIVVNVLFRDYVFPKIKGTHAAPDWKAVRAAIAAKYPSNADEVTEYSEVFFYKSMKDWPHFQTAIVKYMQKYGSHASPNELNNYAWTVFNNCPDMTCVADALNWSKRSFKDKPNPVYMDTYANILYKMGRKDEAINWEQKAAGLATGEDRTNLEATIEKMKKGELISAKN